jgi:hypothetical protein
MESISYLRYDGRTNETPKTPRIEAVSPSQKTCPEQQADNCAKKSNFSGSSSVKQLTLTMRFGISRLLGYRQA